MNAEIRLRPVAEDDLAVLGTLHNTGPDMASPFGWFGWTDPAGMSRYHDMVLYSILRHEVSLD